MSFLYPVSLIYEWASDEWSGIEEKNIGSRGAELWFSDRVCIKYIRLHMLALCAPLLRLYLPAFSELVFLNVYGAPESIPRNEFRQPM